MISGRNYTVALFSTSSVQFIRLFTSLGLNLWIANSLGVKLFGEATLLLVFSNLSIFISSEASRLAILKFKILNLFYLKKIVIFNLVIGFFTSAIFCAYLIFIADYSFSLKLFLLFFLIPFSSFYQSLVAIDQLKDNYFYLGMKQVFSLVIGVLVAVLNQLFFADNLTLAIYIVASYLTFIVLSLFNEISKVKDDSIAKSSDFQIDNLWLLKSSVYGSLGMTGNQAPLIIIENFLNKFDFGIFALAWRIFEASYRSIVAVLSQVFTPVISLAKNSKERGKILMVCTIIVVFSVSITSNFLNEFSYLLVTFLDGNWDGLKERITQFAFLILILSMSSLSSQNIFFDKKINISVTSNFFKLMINSMVLITLVKVFQLNIFLSLILIFSLETILLLGFSMKKENLRSYMQILLYSPLVILSVYVSTEISFGLFKNIYVSFFLNSLLWGFLFTLVFFLLTKERKINNR